MTPLWRSFAYAWAGIWYALCTQRNMRLHLAAAILVLLLGWWLELERWEWLTVALAVALMFFAELVNTAIESVVNLSTQGRYHPQAKIAKDVAAGAALVAAAFALLVGLMVLGPALWEKGEALWS